MNKKAKIAEPKELPGERVILHLYYTVDKPFILGFGCGICHVAAAFLSLIIHDPDCWSWATRTDLVVLSDIATDC